ncbi:MAG: sigma-70 family RNA polymerase sigma factor [Isosphaeraceae bacterium]|nr:sigma-70 family RNA polymerase sigma factor [Isosphaeraceae bacterium]
MRFGGLPALSDYVERVARAILRPVPGYETADLVQSVWLSVLRKRRPFRFVNIMQLRAFLAAVARNKARDVLRKAVHRKRVQASLLENLSDFGLAEPERELVSTEPSPPEQAVIGEIERKLAARLSPRESAVLELRRDGTNLAAIARAVGVHPQTARDDLRSIQAHIRRPRRTEVVGRAGWTSEWDLDLRRSRGARPALRNERLGVRETRSRRHGESKSVPEARLEPGDRIGIYRVLAELGRGAVARVYLALADGAERRLVALKVSQRLSGEAAILERLDHPHIVDVVGHSIDAKRSLQYLAMPYVDGAGLDRILERIRAFDAPLENGRAFLDVLDQEAAAVFRSLEIPDRPAPAVDAKTRVALESATYPQVAIWIVERIALALDHARIQGIAHGDLKPSNLLISLDGSPILLDFNLAVSTRARSNRRRSCGGTLPYMAPEVLRRFVSASTSVPIDPHRADLYSLGIILLELLTRRQPSIPTVEGGPRAIASALAEAREREPDLADLDVSTDGDAIRRILTKALAPDPSRRYARASRMAADLYELLTPALQGSLDAQVSSAATAPPLRGRRRNSKKG